MTARPDNADLQLLLLLLDEACYKKSWHGTNLCGSVRGLSAKQAAWKPGPQRKCIWQHVQHTAYWKYTIRRRLTGEKRGAFALSGSNWFPLPKQPSEAAWRETVALLKTEHALLRDAVAALSPTQLHARARNSQLTNAFVIRGAALHDIYHTGQIQLLKRLWAR